MIKKFQEFLLEHNNCCVGIEINEDHYEDGLIVYGRTQEDNQKISDWIDNSDYSAEFDVRGNFWFFPEAEENYDTLRSTLEDAFDEEGIKYKIEQI